MWTKIFNYKILFMFFHGISAGLPLLLVGSTLQAWMTESEIDMKLIGAASLLQLPYTLKFLWAPLIDRFQIPFLGRRKGWILVNQIFLSLFLILLGNTDPKTNLSLLGIYAFMVAFFSANQDIAIDAYRREILEDNQLGLGSSMYIVGYRIAILISGGLALGLAESIPWDQVYTILSIVMGALAVISLLAPKEDLKLTSPKTFKETVVEPFTEFFSREKPWLILLFILMFKMGDSMAANLTVPYFLKMNFTKEQIAIIVKGFGLFSTIGGGLLGGIIMIKWGIYRSLWYFGILQALSTLAFVLVEMNPTIPVLSFVIAFENVSSGLGTSAYSAFIASITNKKFTATQFALLTALMAVPRVIVSAPTGILQEYFGWGWFFTICTVIAIPGMYLLKKLNKSENIGNTAS
jgi:PAT family beta-lactamase induction signal transducer AmpG